MVEAQYPLSVGRQAMKALRPDEDAVRHHLVEFALSFILSESSDRYSTLALSERGMKKWRSELDHFQRRLRLELATAIPPAHRTVDGVRLMLGVKQYEIQAVAFSTNRRLLSGVGDLTDILEDVIATDIGAIVSIVPGKTALYWGEESDAKFVLELKE